MTIPEACSLVLEAGAMGEGGEIYVFDMGSPVKIRDLAENMIRLVGLRPYLDINIVYSGLRPGEKLYE
jgi:FlaA1/EpsC-like NDP-sugar epimerase